MNYCYFEFFSLRFIFIFSIPKSNQPSFINMNVQEVARKIANYEIRLVPFESEEKITEYPDTIEITGAQSCFDYVKTYGSWITKLFIDYGPEANVHATLVKRINKHCRKSLREITIRRLSHIHLMHHKSHFTGVQRVRIENSNGPVGLKTFSNIFQSVVRLEIIDVKFVVEKRGRFKIPKNLLHFKIFDRHEKNFGNMNSLYRLWGTSRELQSMEIYMPNASKITWRNLMRTIEKNTSIRCLKVQTPIKLGLTTVTDVQIRNFCKKYHHLEDLQLDSFKFEIRSVRLFFRGLPNLREFRFQIVRNSAFARFVKAHPGYIEDFEPDLVTLYSI